MITKDKRLDVFKTNSPKLPQKKYMMASKENKG